MLFDKQMSHGTADAYRKEQLQAGQGIRQFEIPQQLSSLQFYNSAGKNKIEINSSTVELSYCYMWYIYH